MEQIPTMKAEQQHVERFGRMADAIFAAIRQWDATEGQQDGDESLWCQALIVCVAAFMRGCPENQRLDFTQRLVQRLLESVTGQRVETHIVAPTAAPLPKSRVN